jgi:hypothetical protein
MPELDHALEWCRKNDHRAPQRARAGRRRPAKLFTAIIGNAEEETAALSLSKRIETRDSTSLLAGEPADPCCLF